VLLLLVLLLVLLLGVVVLMVWVVGPCSNPHCCLQVPIVGRCRAGSRSSRSSSGGCSDGCPGVGFSIYSV
jgi:hypothetical protein